MLIPEITAQEAASMIQNGELIGLGGFGPDPLEVYQKAFGVHMLPSNCRRAVLSLVPKKGDLGLLKNWRPVSLLCLDYNILSRCLANRLKLVLDSIVFY